MKENPSKTQSSQVFKVKRTGKVKLCKDMPQCMRQEDENLNWDIDISIEYSC